MTRAAHITLTTTRRRGVLRAALGRNQAVIAAQSRRTSDGQARRTPHSGRTGPHNARANDDEHTLVLPNMRKKLTTFVTPVSTPAPCECGGIVFEKTEMTALQLQRLLDRAGLSQRGAAKALEINERTMRKYVAGESKVPKTVELALLYLCGFRT